MNIMSVIRGTVIASFVIAVIGVATMLVTDTLSMEWMLVAVAYFAVAIGFSTVIFNKAVK